MYNNFDLNEQQIITTREQVSIADKITIIRNMINNMITPTKHIISAISNNGNSTSYFQMVTSIFQSMRFDVDIFNMEFLDKSSIDYKMLNTSYENNGCYMLSSSVVRDKKKDELVILFELYKPKEVNPIEFMDRVFEKNPELLAFLYIKEMIALSNKNYRNKFTISNKARITLNNTHPELSIDKVDEISMMLTQLAMDFHTNSIIIDNLNSGNLVRPKDKTINNINELKNSTFVAYNPNYSYKDKTQIDILDELLKDANIDVVSGFDNGLNNLNNQNNQGKGEEPNDGSISEPAEAGEYQTENTEMGNDSSSPDNAIDSDSNNPSHSGTSSSDNDLSSDRDSVYENMEKNSQWGDLGTSKAEIVKVTFNNSPQTILFAKLPSTKPNNDRYESLDNASESSMNHLQDYVDRSLGKLRGSGINEIFENIGAPIEIDTNWTEDILKRIDNKTNIIKSTSSYCTWAKINTYTRHICKLPGRIYKDIGVPVIYIMFDQSGSMSNNDIRKINYLIDHFYKKRYIVNVFIHDHATNADDVKVFEFNPVKSSSYNENDMDINELISSRIMAGGTSHRGVFDLMEAYIRDVKSGDKKYSNHFCIICSDMYSDIDEIYTKYEWINLLGNTNIFNVTERGNPTLPFGKMIYI